mmetsp:Transcript_11708/g.21048  ORF Transcript_11708/g.21048 Transcript_11708/m.21048 type:complete len:224 (-) Transcript_11708:325-996(-)
MALVHAEDLKLVAVHVVVLDAVDVEGDVVEAADGVEIATLHEVGEAGVEVEADGGADDAGGEEVLLVEEVDGVNGFQSSLVVADEAAHAEEAEEGEVAHETKDVGLVGVEAIVGIELDAAIFLKLLNDAGTVDETLEGGGNGFDGPNVLATLHALEILVVHVGGLAAVLAPVLELIAVLVDEIPNPLVGEDHIDVIVQEKIKQFAVVLERVNPVLKSGNALGE